jgi:glutathione S-transferase
MTVDAPKFVLHDAANSPAGRRVRIMLLEKGQTFEIRWLNLALLDQKRPDYLALNPNGLVPTLLHEGRVLFDSTVINEYLEEIFPVPRLVPGEPWGRADMRMCVAFELELAKPFRDAVYETHARRRIADSGLTVEALAAATEERGAALVHRQRSERLLTTPSDPQRLQESYALLIERLEWLERRLGDGRPWLLGDRFTLADITVAPRLALFPLIGMADVPRTHPCIGAYLQRMGERPSFRQSDLSPAPGELVRRVSP